MRSRWALAPLLYVLVAGKAFAQDEAAITAAYEHAAQGLTAFEQGQNTDALDKFSRAYTLLKIPSLAVYLARAQVKLGHYTAAAALYAEATRLQDGPGDPEMQQNAREEAQREGQALQARIPRLIVQTPGIDIQTVTIQVDGVVIPSAALAEGWRLDPGVHRIVATSGGQRLEQSELVSDGVTKTIVFAFPATGSNAPENHYKSGRKTPVAAGDQGISQRHLGQLWNWGGGFGFFGHDGHLGRGQAEPGQDESAMGHTQLSVGRLGKRVPRIQNTAHAFNDWFLHRPGWHSHRYGTSACYAGQSKPSSKRGPFGTLGWSGIRRSSGAILTQQSQQGITDPETSPCPPGVGFWNEPREKPRRTGQLKHPKR